MRARQVVNLEMLPKSMGREVCTDLHAGTGLQIFSNFALTVELRANSGRFVVGHGSYILSVDRSDRGFIMSIVWTSAHKLEITK